MTGKGTKVYNSQNDCQGEDPISILAERLRQFSDGDVMEIGKDLVKGVIPPDIRDFKLWATMMDEAAEALISLSQERDRLREESERKRQRYNLAAGKVAELTAEVVRLRAALAQSDQPWFPGCARGDDAVGCPELGARLEVEDLSAEKGTIMTIKQLEDGRLLIVGKTAGPNGDAAAVAAYSALAEADAIGSDETAVIIDPPHLVPVPPIEQEEI